MLFRNRLLSSLPERDAELLRPHLREVHLTKGLVLADVGDRISQVLFPSSAVLSVVVSLEDGRTVEVATLGMEGASHVLECLGVAPSTTRMFAQIPGSAFAVDAGVLRQRAAQSPELLRRLLRHVKAANSQAEQNVACNALHEAPGRLAKWLLMTEDRTGTPAFPLTQDYMAVMVGVQRSTVNGAAVELRDKGLIRYTRGSVQVLDRVGLQARACECYEAVQERTASLELAS